MTDLLIKNLGKSYDNQSWVLKDINLEIKEGEFVVLVGPSGCGKSTLLRLIAGLEQPTTGEIYMGSHCVNQTPPVNRDIAMVFQDYALYPHMSVKENLSFGLKIRKIPRDIIESKVKEAAEMLNISHLLDRKPAQLSGGQRQRVAIGRTIVREPKLYLFDEPLSNLDAKLRSEMRIDLANLHQRVGKTSIYVTHDQQEAMTLADKIVIIAKGQIQQVGSPIEVYNYPANKTVAGFIGSPGMNFFQGNLDFSHGKKIFKLADQELEFNQEYNLPEKPGHYILGLRPEDFSVKPQESSQFSTPCLKADLVIKELHGHETQVIANSNHQNIVARTSQLEEMNFLKDSKSGQPLSLPIATKHLHWFEVDNQNRVTTIH